MSVLPGGPAVLPEQIDSTDSTAVAFPVARLLPSSVTDGKRVGRARLLAMGCVGASALVVGGLWMVTAQQASDAESQLADAQSTASVLAAQRAKFSEIPQVQGQVSTASADVVRALGDEVLWSRVLAQLAASAPRGVTITKASGSLTSATAGTPAGATPTATGTTGTTGATGATVGTLRIGGTAASFPDVAAWLDRVAEEKLFAHPTLGRSAREESADSTDVGFEGTVDLSATALSGRHQQEGSR